MSFHLKYHGKSFRLNSNNIVCLYKNFQTLLQYLYEADLLNMFYFFKHINRRYNFQLNVYFRSCIHIFRDKKYWAFFSFRLCCVNIWKYSLLNFLVFGCGRGPFYHLFTYLNISEKEMYVWQNLLKYVHFC